MITCTCIVQAGQIPVETKTRLRSNLTAFAERSFGASAEIIWRTVPEGSGLPCQPKSPELKLLSDR